MQWFRMYAEAVDDEKLRLLSFDDRWHFVALLCCMAQGILDEKDPTLRKERLRVKLGLDSVELERVMKQLETKKLVSKNWKPLGWKDRQFVSDSSTRRVREFRKRQCNVSETAPEQKQNRTEQREERRPSRRCPSDFNPDPDYALTRLPDLDVAAEIQKFRDCEFKKPRSDWAATWRTWVAKAKEIGYARISAKPKRAFV